MLRYNKIVCWVYPREKEELETAIDRRFPVVFAKTKKEFIEKLSAEVFPVISLKKACKINALLKLVRAYPSMPFYIMRQDLADEPITFNESFFLGEPNIFIYKRMRSNFDATELADLFEGKDIIV